MPSAAPPSRGPDFSLPISAKGSLWMKQNGVTEAQLSEVFHFEKDSVEIIIGEMPGSGTRDKVRNAHILLGLCGFLAKGTATVEDKVGPALCERFGIFDGTNHSKAFKGVNELTGSAKAGWTVTSPGLRQAAALVKRAKPND